MNDFLSGYNFARRSDVVFSETIPENGTHKTYIVDYFEINDSNIIFCKTDNVINLFEILKYECELKNIKLITHESDYEINQKLFELKPQCISKWYSTNVNYSNENLIPIPLGIANDYCPITLKYEQIIETTKINHSKKLLYINHRNNTNPKKRQWIYDYFKTNEWCSVDQPNLSLDDYIHQLNSHHFILCPNGNGIDTHRLWESLYCGITPIVEDNIHANCLTDLPILKVNSFKDVTKDLLVSTLKQMHKTKYNYDKLKVSWWINKMKKI